MVANLWFYYAVGAALCWGLGYVLSERVMQAGLGPAFLLAVVEIVTLPMYILLAYHFSQIKTGIDIVFSSWKMLSLVGISALLVAAGNYFILSSIAGKNATMASIIEISYPVFTFIFAWLLFRDVQINAHTALGGLLIFSGIALIFFKS